MNKFKRWEMIAKIIAKRKNPLMNESQKRWKKINPEKVVIQTKTRNLIKNNELKIKKKKCVFCGSKKHLELHHKKYTVNKKDILILCKSCHQKEHSRLNGNLLVKCNRCSHKWFQKTEKTPMQCPACCSPFWDKTRVRKIKKDCWAKKRK